MSLIKVPCMQITNMHCSGQTVSLAAGDYHALWYYEAVRHTTFTIELRCQVKLPRLQRGLVTGGDDTLELILQWFVAQLPFIGCRIKRSLFHIRIAECCCHGPTT